MNDLIQFNKTATKHEVLEDLEKFYNSEFITNEYGKHLGQTCP